MQLKAMGGNIAEAYVMVHSFDKINTRLYSRMHPNTRYPPNCNNPEDTLFLVPFKEALEKYPPSSVSAQSGSPDRAFGGTPLLNLMRSRYYTTPARWSGKEWDYRGRGANQKAPVIYADFSSVVGLSLWNYILTAESKSQSTYRSF